MRRLLCITHAFPPQQNPVAITLAKLLRHLDASRWAVTILCADPIAAGARSDEALAALVPPSVRVNIVRGPDRFALVRGAIRVLPLVRELPDVHALWVRAAARVAMTLLARERFDALLSWSSPLASHCAARHAARHSGLPWIAYFSDPWCRNPYRRTSAPAARWNARQEHALLAETSRVIVNSAGVRDVLLASAGASHRAKTVMIPHAFDRSLMPSRAPTNTRCTFLHAGAFYGRRSPHSLLEAIAYLRRDAPDLVALMRCVFLGSVAQEHVRAAHALGVADVVAFEEPVSYRASLAAMVASDILLVVDAPADGPSIFQPAKLIEALGARRPILALTPPVGETARIVRALRVGTVVPVDDIAAIATALAALVAQWQSGTLAWTGDDVACNAYDARAVAVQFAACFDDAVRVHSA